MKRAVQVLLWGAAIAWADHARADMSAPPEITDGLSVFSSIQPTDQPLSIEPSSSTAVSSHLRHVDRHRATERYMDSIAPVLWRESGLPFTISDDLATGPSSPQVKALPPGPSSLALVLSALLSAGAWHLGRSARHLHLSDVPEWYHTACPAQIGHTVPFDFHFTTLPLCCFDQPVGRRPPLYHVRRDQVPHSDATSFLVLTTPRGPPALS